MLRRHAGLRQRLSVAALRASRWAPAWLRAALCLHLLVLAFDRNAAAQTGVQEYEMKAAFLLNFAKFVKWPPKAMDGGSFVIGIYGHNPFDKHLEELTSGRQVGGRSIVVRMIHTPVAARNTHILFIPGAEDDRVPELIDALRGSNVLMVGESDAFARRGGAITFLIENGKKLRFEVDLTAAKRAGVQMASQLLSLAKTVRGK